METFVAIAGLAIALAGLVVTIAGLRGRRARRKSRSRQHALARDGGTVIQVSETNTSKQDGTALGVSRVEQIIQDSED